jgi:hypothetical protein
MIAPIAPSRQPTPQIARHTSRTTPVINRTGQLALRAARRGLALARAFGFGVGFGFAAAFE